MKNWRIGLFGIAVSAITIGFFYTQVDHVELLSALATANYIYVLPCIVLLLLGLVTRAMRWHVLLDSGLSLLRAFSIMNIAYLVNGILPLRIGEVARVYLASKAKPPVPIMKSASTIVTERLLDLLAVIVMALFSLFAAPLPDEIRTVALLMGPLALVGFFVLVVLARYRLFTEQVVQNLSENFSVLQRLHLSEWSSHFLDGLVPLTKWNTLFYAVGLTGLSWGISACAGYVLMLAFYDTASWTTTFLYIAAAAFAIAVPAIPGNVGTYEGAILLALNATGYAAYTNAQIDGVALSFAVMVHAVNLFVHASTGIAGFLQEGISLQQLSQGVTQMQHAGQDVR